MRDAIDSVQLFHERFGLSVAVRPTADVPPNVVALRVRLLREEVDEYEEAALAGDLVAVADALTDIMYVLCGTYVTHGLQDAAEELFAEVQRSNMSKLDENGRPHHDAGGKVVKSALYSEPELAPILAKYTGRVAE